ncbi:hypothetical protein [Bacillus sp. FJAT-50079]|uniref:hypothetical protein n=1 Tax=Bacillus sp. FJAT-50079 TaxID=2833577 RepID=UPI001BC9C8F1|nr:hypothetical protein [Bacillus sp. FJAT-50079]MBS4207448.1 hypothetical protein [Bacillus sp. FJAT-50079]
MITLYQDCIIIYEIGRDGYGKPIKKNEQFIKCRVKEKYQLVKDKSAKEVVSQLEIIISPDVDVKVDDKVEYEGLEYTIISLKITRNTIGEVVKKVIFV